MPSARSTLYDELGLDPNAKPHEIGLAWQRYLADQQKETTMPDARRTARVRQAFETLSDPQRRAEYDASLTELPEEGPAASRRSWMAVAALAVVAIGAGAYFAMRPKAPAAVAPEPLVTQAAGLRVASLQGALPSGEVRELGFAVEIAEDLMAIPCRGFEAGMALTARQSGAALRAELLNANEALEICILTVRGVSSGAPLLEGLPAQGEKLFVVLPGATEARAVEAGPPVPGLPQAFALAAGRALANGTPLFDAQGRLAGLVVAPHEKGTGFAVVLGAPRVKQARPQP